MHLSVFLKAFQATSRTLCMHKTVDPHISVRTQEVEVSWSQLKLGQKRRKGIRREDLQAYLDKQNVAVMERGNLLRSNETSVSN